MYFEFDPEKSRQNKEKHGIDFVEAQAILADDSLLEIPARTVGEPRFMIVGKIADKYRSEVITCRSETIRIISVRRSRMEEEAIYESTGVRQTF